MLLNKNHYLVILSVILLTVILYWPSFSSPFFQDDVVVLRSKNISNFLTTLPKNRYYPVSVQLFYSFSKSVFGLNPFGFHLILFIFSSLSLFLIFSLARKILLDDKKAYLTVFFYAFNISLFANFYWVAVSYFVFGGFFIFLSLYFYWQKNFLTLSLISFVMALLSNELAFVYPFLLTITSWYFKKWSKSLIFFLIIGFLYILFKIFLIGFSTNTDYTLNFFGIFSTARWYLLRAFNLPEGIKFASDRSLLILFVIFLMFLLISFYYRLKSKKIDFRLYLFSLFWFLIGALPFFFLPMHLSSYYLTVALFGISLFFSNLLSENPRILLLAILVYFLLTFRGLIFLSQTHWIILKNTGPIGIM
ncbi:hypothetical protein A2W14_05810 [Candidatus Gottesmanbacteria bacterium RBG_16_37_8]|uniref:Glycosyltransferase RgtA/B/C/D-like domain-containing protein n=1 Tax=Candidatus Gottesmanbacteria bacterium RBG_16_37_8 TaxID=1798371 RepID=A0A1F5YVM8_9BACT|nr:MAG: hypothetical protein A2W14_05810 [Candidatus Gottesmanbacteria bacterium RBG_16_37_8]